MVKDKTSENPPRDWIGFFCKCGAAFSGKEDFNGEKICRGEDKLIFIGRLPPRPHTSCPPAFEWPKRQQKGWDLFSCPDWATMVGCGYIWGFHSTIDPTCHFDWAQLRAWVEGPGPRVRFGARLHCTWYCEAYCYVRCVLSYRFKFPTSWPLNPSALESWSTLRPAAEGSRRKRKRVLSGPLRKAASLTW